MGLVFYTKSINDTFETLPGTLIVVDEAGGIMSYTVPTHKRGTVHVAARVYRVYLSIEKMAEANVSSEGDRVQLYVDRVDNNMYYVKRDYPFTNIAYVGILTTILVAGVGIEVYSTIKTATTDIMTLYTAVVNARYLQGLGGIHTSRDHALYMSIKSFSEGLTPTQVNNLSIDYIRLYNLLVATLANLSTEVYFHV